MQEGGFPKFRDWQFCSIVVPGNPAPIAMGRAMLSSDKATERVGVGAGGKLIEVTHVYRDKLWELGAAAALEAGIPNDGYKVDVVLPLGWNPEDQVCTLCPPNNETVACFTRCMLQRKRV